MVKKKYTCSQKVKGKTYQFFRRDGVRTRLPDDPNSQEYDRAYWALMNGTGSSNAKVRFNFHDLIVSYKDGPKWQKLAPRTKSDYNKILDYIGEKLGAKDPTLMLRAHVIKAQMANKHRARFANYIPHMLSILFEHTIDLGKMKHNPAKGVSKLKTGEGHQAWPELLIQRFLEEADPSTELLVELAIGTGQRIGDLLKMKWSDVEDDGINVVQGKTGTELWIPFTPRLKAILDRTKKAGFFILTNTRGQQLSYNVCEQKFRRVRDKVNGKGFTIHGLRYYAAHQLAESGCTDAQIAAITGHKSVEMVAKYSRKASQKSLARAAQAKRS